MLLYNDQSRAKAEKLVHDMVERAIKMEGTITGEHGIGIVKRDYLPDEVGSHTVDTMRKVSCPTADEEETRHLHSDPVETIFGSSFAP